MRRARVADGLVAASYVVNHGEGGDGRHTVLQKQNAQPVGGKPELPNAGLLVYEVEDA